MHFKYSTVFVQDSIVICMETLQAQMESTILTPNKKKTSFLSNFSGINIKSC